MRWQKVAGRTFDAKTAALAGYDRVGIIHALVSDSFFMKSVRDALPDWPTASKPSCEVRVASSE